MPAAKGKGRKAPVKRAAAKKAPVKKVRAAAPKASKPAPKAAPPAKQPPAPAAPPVDINKPLGSVDVDSLSGDALRQYARRAGVSPRDVEALSEDRLRQNTKLTIQNHFDLISEG